MSSAIVVFSHLRWDFVYRRPQHLLSRLAAHHPIIFIEEPVYHPEQAFFHTYSPAPNILVCQPNTPVDMPGFHDDHLPYLQKLLRQLIRDYPDHIAWFYTPMALPLLQELSPQRVVYDCMDELASFKNAPRQLLQRESALLKVADIVFTGGPSLYRAKSSRHPNVHCFPGSVDASHFVQALDRTNSHPAHKDIPGPRLGFFGVIDERIDTDLIAEVADAHPMWQIVLVGPVSGIDPGSLPMRSNIHYLGQQAYAELPHFLAGWDVCMLPFARNESTRFIHPTKTLEYMAAELPIVSTPVADIVESYADVVAIAEDAGAFIAACEAALLAPPDEHLRKVEKMRAVLAETSWEETAEKMRVLLDTTPRRTDLMSEDEAGLDNGEPAASINRLRQNEPLRQAKTLVIGAGATGLSAAYHLGYDAVVLEKNDTVGGCCRSIKDNGFTFDHAGHIMGATDPYVRELYDILLGSNVHWQRREAAVYLNQTYVPYPLRQTSASFSRNSNGAQPADFEQFLCQTWGRDAARNCVIPYSKKLWTVPLNEMETTWLKGDGQAPDLDEVPEGMIPRTDDAADACFGYPLRGGFQALMSGFVPHIKGTVELNAEVIQLSPRERIVALADGRRYQYDKLISTMPLPELARIIGSDAPDEVRQAAAGLQHVSLRCVNLGVARENITDKHWIYYPEGTVFHRVFAQGNVSPECHPEGGFGLTCEIAYSPDRQPLPAVGRELIERCIQDCIKVGLLREDDQILAANEVDIPYAYPLCDHARARNVDIIKAWLAEHDIIVAGRYGEWEYGDHAFNVGRRAADTIKWMEEKNVVAVE